MKNKSFILFLLAAANFTHIMDIMIIMPLSDRLMKLFEIAPQEYTLLVSAYSSCAFVAGLLGAVYLDKFDRRIAFLFVYAFFGIATFACSFVPNFYFFLIFRGIAGFFGGVIGALVLAIASDLFEAEERGKAVGIIMMAFSIASVIGVPTGLYLAIQFDWHAPFQLLGALSFVIWIISFKYIPSLREHIDIQNKDDEGSGYKETRKEALLELLNSKNARLALLLTFTLILGQFMIIPFITPYMIRNIGFTEAQITLIYLTGGGFTIFTSPFFGRYVDRFGARKMFNIILPISFIAVGLLTHLDIILDTPIWLALCVTTFFFVFGSGRRVPAQTQLTMAISAKRRASFMSLNSSVQQLASAIASVVGGFIVIEADTPSKELIHYNWVGVIAVCIGAIALIIFPMIKSVRD
ncbi:MFS transporter [Bernardetia sp. ABR2-2B]|uniref:MFS transporter n=1 Tax=Bernardetia sp. ABR2-2B TaxID=3127472 RepID=UPI0030CDB89D